MKVSLKVDGRVVKIDAPAGYHRVSNGYTRNGDLALIDTTQHGLSEWRSVMELKFVSTFACVIRKKEKK